MGLFANDPRAYIRIDECRPLYQNKGLQTSGKMQDIGLKLRRV